MGTTKLLLLDSLLQEIVQNEVVNSDPCGDDALSASIMFHE